MALEQHRLPSALRELVVDMNTDYLQYAVPVFFALILIEACYSHFKGLRLYNLRNSLSCLGCGVFTTTLELFVKAGLVGLYAWVFENYSLMQLSDASWVTWIAGLIVFDFLWYWAHRISHEVNVLWGGHVTHHQSEEFNLTAGLRQGALQDLMYWPLYLLMAIAGFSAEMFVAQLLINKFYGFWLHTRAIDKLPLIEGILGTPSAHRVHHGMNDHYIDKNHGGILMVFDRMFGTYQAEDEEVMFGVRKRFASFNPVLAHFDWLLCLWRDACQTQNRWDRWRIWFMPTGWRPVDVENSNPRQRFSTADYQKFDAQPGQYSVRLALAIFVLVSVANQILLLNTEPVSWLVKGLGAALITVGLLWMGKLLDESKRVSDLQTGVSSD